MKLNKVFKLDIIQIGIFKLAVVSCGILIGLYFRDFFLNLIPLLWMIFIVAGAYICYVFHKQK